MKKFLILAAVLVAAIFLSKLANEVPKEQPSGAAFWLQAQKVVACSPHEIVLEGKHGEATRLDRDESWPDCSTFSKDEMRDFELVRGGTTRYLTSTPTAWWRKQM